MKGVTVWKHNLRYVILLRNNNWETTFGPVLVLMQTFLPKPITFTPCYIPYRCIVIFACSTVSHLLCMAYYTCLVTGYPTDYIDTKFVEIDTKLTKILPKIIICNSLGKNIGLRWRWYDYTVTTEKSSKINKTIISNYKLDIIYYQKIHVSTCPP